MSPTSRQRFAEVVRSDPVDLGLACLLLAQEADARGPGEAADPVAAGLAELDRLAAELPGPGPATTRLRTVLHEFHGDDSEYQDLRASLLPEVLRRRRGLPILLSVVWLEVSRRAAIPSYGIGLPGHFVVGIGDPDGYHEVVDPFRGGRRMSAAQIRRQVEAVAGPAGDTPEAQFLRPWEPVEILQRVLANIRSWADRPDRLRTRRWALELALLLPRHPLELRHEHGRVMVQLGGFAEGAAALEDYAATIEALDPEAAERAAREATAARARLN